MASCRDCTAAGCRLPLLLIWAVLWGCGSSFSGAGAALQDLPAETKPSVARFYGALPQRGKAKSISATGPRYDTCELPVWLPATGLVNTTVYLGIGAYNEGQACGMCVAYRSRNEDDVKYGIVGGWCPSCKESDLGLSSAAGQFRVGGEVVWAPVQCDTGCIGIIYALNLDIPSMTMMLKFVQTRVPVEKVEVKVDNMFLPLVSKRSGYWKVPDEALTTGVPPTSMQLSLVSVLGDRLDDNIVSLEWQESDGQLMALRNLQWPVSSRYASMVDREPSCSNDGLVWFPIPAEKDEDKEEEISTPAATTLSPTPSPTTAPKTQTPSPTADIPGPQPTTPAPPNDFDFSSELIPNFFRPAEVPKFPWEALSGFSLPVETTVPTAAPQTPPPTEAPMPIGDLCALCQVTFKPVCDKNRTLYINPCFALCKGLKESEVSQRQCTGGARSGDLSFDIASCVPCEKRGYSEVCNEAQGRFVNQCFAVECLNQDPDSVSAELCGAST